MKPNLAGECCLPVLGRSKLDIRGQNIFCAVDKSTSIRTCADSNMHVLTGLVFLM